MIEHTAPTQRMFVAVTPPADVLRAIDDLPTRAQRGVRYTRRDQWHITVLFLGDADPTEATEALDGLAASPAEVTLGPAVTLLGTRVLIVPASGLEELAASTATAFAGIGEQQDDRDYLGHLTLARLKGAPLRDPATVSVLGAPVDERFMATRLTLFTSEPGPDESSHAIVSERGLAP